jgi:hypothetical protein
MAYLFPKLFSPAVNLDKLDKKDLNPEIWHIFAKTSIF